MVGLDFVFFGSVAVFSQVKPSAKVLPTKAKDTVITEVIEIETKYNPEIADATKIKRNPTITVSERNKRKKLECKLSVWSDLMEEKQKK